MRRCFRLLRRKWNLYCDFSSAPYDRPAIAATQTFDRRDYAADRLATTDMYRRRTPPAQTTYGGA